MSVQAASARAVPEVPVVLEPEAQVVLPQEFVLQVQSELALKVPLEPARTLWAPTVWALISQVQNEWALSEMVQISTETVRLIKIECID